MKRIIFMLAISMVFNFTYAQRNTSGSPEYKITLSSSKVEYALGEEIFISVEYYNGSDSVWKLYRPDSSFYNSLNYRNILWRTEEIWSGYAFNKSKFINIDPDCPECGFAVALTGGVIQIKPKQKYSFETELMEGQKDHAWILPGKYLVEYYDGYEAIQSDTIEICLKFTEKSVDFLLKRLLDEKENRSNVEWIVKLLNDIYPDIMNYQYQHKDNTISYTDEQTENNRKLLEDFKLYWEQNKYTKVMLEKIHKVNTDLRKYYFIDMRRAKQSGKGCINYD